jgi:hypothetical protein
MPDYLKIILLLLSWIAIGFACHMYIKRYFLASLAAAIAIMILTQVMGYIELGYLDPLWFVGTITSFFMGSLVALIVGLPFRLVRKLEKEPPE